MSADSGAAQLGGSAQEMLNLLNEQFENLAQLYAVDVDEDADTIEDEDPEARPATSVVEACDELVEEIEQLNAILEAATEHLEGLATFCEGEARAWQQQFANVVSAAESMAATIGTEAQQIGAVFQAVQTRIGEHDQRLSALATDMVQRTDTVAARTRDELVDLVHSTGERFVGDLDRRCRSPLEQCYRESGANLQDALDEFRGGALAELQCLTDEVNSIKDNLLSGIRSGVECSVRGATDSLITAASERIATTVTESIMMTQLGTQLTSSMAPILPQLIAINKVAELIRQAIKVFKMARMGL